MNSPLAEITDYDDLLAALRARADELEISRETIDHIAGFPDRYAGKILSLSHPRRIGLRSLGPILSALGMKLIAVADDSALERNRSRMVKRDKSQVRVHRLAV
jgi:hypothetical protein